MLQDRETQKQAGEQSYASQVDWTDYTVNKPTWGQDPVRFSVEGDDKFKTKKWEAMMGDCAFYFDNPTLSEESNMKKTLLTKYDDLFAGPMRPTLQSRKDLVGWACMAQNAWMAEKGAPSESLMDCSRYQGLIDKYGPDYSTLRNRVGHIKGLF